MFVDLCFFAGVGGSNGELWKRQRRFTVSTFRNLGLGKSSFEELIVTECKELVNYLKRLRIDDGQSFNPKSVFPLATANMICSFAFGRRYDYSNEEYKFVLHSIQKIDRLYKEIGGAQMFLPFFKYLPTKRNRELHESTKVWIEFIGNIVTEHEAEFNPDCPNDYIDIYLKEIQTFTDDLLTLGNLRASVAGLFFAGHGTTANTMRWAIYCMLKFPDIQMAVQTELDAVVGPDRLPTLADKAHLPYTEATLLEIQRYGSTARFGIGHTAAEDTELFGYTILKGSYLLPNLWAVHHDPTLWHNPEEFQPTRFLNDERAVETPQEFIPFGIGMSLVIQMYLFRTINYVKIIPRTFHIKLCKFITPASVAQLIYNLSTNLGRRTSHLSCYIGYVRHKSTTTQ